MERRNIMIIGAASAFLIIFLSFSFAVRNTEAIWLETRIVGLLAYFALFLTVLIGELRMLSKVKGDFRLFRFHKPIAIFAVTLVFMHMAVAIMDNFKWGKQLGFLQFMGFSFSDKWLVLLSLGSLAFYLMLIVALTSMPKAISTIGFKRWKIIHYFSYISFVFAQLHSVNLGTDLNHSAVQGMLTPIFAICFMVVLALLITRLINGFFVFEDQREINLAAVFFLLLIIGSVFLGAQYVKKEESLKQLKTGLETTKQKVSVYEERVSNLDTETQALKQQTEVTGNG